MQLTSSIVVSIISLVLALILAYSTYMQMRAVNMPLLFSRMDTVRSGTLDKHLTLVIRNNGPGAAKNVCWNLLINEPPKEHHGRICQNFPNYNSAESRKFTKEIPTLGANSEIEVKGLLFLGEDTETGTYYELSIQFQGALSWLFKKYSKFDFSVYGELLDFSSIKKEQFKESEEKTRKWMEELEEFLSAQEHNRKIRAN